MQPDDAYLLNILNAAHKVRQFVEGVTWEEFLEDEIRQNAVMRMIQIIGEAATRVSGETRAMHPEIP